MVRIPGNSISFFGTGICSSPKHRCVAFRSSVNLYSTFFKADTGLLMAAQRYTVQAVRRNGRCGEN